MSPTKQLCLLLFLFLIVLLHAGDPTNMNGTTIMVSARKFRGNKTDHLALLAIKSEIHYDPQGRTRSWNNSLHHCSWSGVICSRRHKRVTTLDLSARGLGGILSPFIGNLSFLHKILVYNNTFHGAIPSQVGKLVRLRILLLQNNHFEGAIPISLSSLSLKTLNLSFNELEGAVPMGGIFNNSEVVSLTGNDGLCGVIPQLSLPGCTTSEPENSSHPPKNPKKGVHLMLLILLVPISGVGVGLLIILLIWSRSRPKKIESLSSKSSVREPFFKISYAMLLKATNGFSHAHLIGEGNFASVYKGIMEFDTHVLVIAVKVFKLQCHGAAKSFMVECKASGSIRHRNLVRILSVCSGVDFNCNEFKALVYEYLPNGSLERWLHWKGTGDREYDNEFHNLNLLQRVNIAIDVACALDYLHYDCHTPIIHCDLKPSNILLDNDMRAYVGDFGLAKFITTLPNQNQNMMISSSIGFRGTIGYAPPEYGLGGLPSKRGDVYSFGITLLEMMTRKRPTDPLFQNGLNLHKFVKMALPNGVGEIDARLMIDDCNAATSHRAQNATQADNCTTLRCIHLIMEIGVACSLESPTDRMSTRDAIRKLKLAKDTLLGARTMHNLRSL
ncbi:hypothetical protein Ancab_012277 [Ancistrocladus abbreviatus]